MVASLRKRIRDTFAADLEVVLGKILWPKKSAALPASLLEAFTTAVGKLLMLQKPEIDTQERALLEGASSSKTPAALLPLEVMVEPLAARFQYHFSGDRPTNRADKPEYFISHFFETLTTHVEFINDYIQPLLLEHFQDTSHQMSLAYLDATSAFITALLPMLRHKAFTLFSQVSHQSQLLSHLIHELMTFDTTLRDDWHYEGNGSPSLSPWKGLTSEVLSKGSHFEHWLSIESTFVLNRYENIISEPANAVLDHDSVPAHTTKPTTAALLIHDLITTTTSTYQPLTSLGRKLRFLIDVQISLLDRYHSHLYDGLHDYLTQNSILARNLNIHLQPTTSSTTASSTKPATDTASSHQGTAGLDRLCRIFGSADYLERSMRDWSDDLFFLELKSELQARAQADSQDPVAGTMDIADIASKTSASLAVADDDAGESLDPDAGALFDEPAAKYAALRARVEGVIIDTLKYQVRESLRPYARNASFTGVVGAASAATSIPDSDGSADVDAAANTDAPLISRNETDTNTETDPQLPPQSTLSGTLTHLSTTLTLLSRALAPLPLHRIALATLRAADTFIFERAVLSREFSEDGARQLCADLDAVGGVVDGILGRGGTGQKRRDVGRKGLVRSWEACRLLSLPASEGTSRIERENDDDEADDDEVDDDDDAYMDDGGTPTTKTRNISLWTAEQRIMASNASARALLASLGIHALTEQEARRVLRCRGELRE